MNGQDEFGGALFNLGTATVSDCTFTNNQVLGGGNVNSNLGGGAGGAIDNYDGATLMVTGSLFSNNRVVSADGNNGYYSLGGAIENNAGTGTMNDDTPSTANLIDCTFLDNLSQAGTLGVSNGGAICSEGGGTIMTLTGCLISGNRSVGGAGGSNNQGDGGGVMVEAGSTTYIVGCTITGNQVVGGINGDLTQDSRSGAAFGGGVDNLGATMYITNSIISSNIAQGAATATGPGGIAKGGGIENNSSAHLDSDGQPDMEQHRHRRSRRRGRHLAHECRGRLGVRRRRRNVIHIDRDAGRLHHRRQCRPGQCGHQRQSGRRRYWRWPGCRRHIPERSL